MRDAKRLDEWGRTASLMALVSQAASGKKCKPSDIYPPLSEVETNGKPMQGTITDLKMFLPNHGR